MKHTEEVWLSPLGDFLVISHGDKGWWSHFTGPGQGFTPLLADRDRHTVFLLSYGFEKLGNL